MIGERELAHRLEPLLAGLGTVGVFTTHFVAVILAIVCITFLHVVLGEMVPKSMALASPRSAVFLTVPFGLTTKALLLPFVLALEFISNRIMRAVGIDRSTGALSHSAEDLRHFIQVSQEGGQLATESGRALSEMFEFLDLKAEEVMVPRVSLHSLPLESTPEAIGQVLKEGQHTRYPVYEDDLDQIVGMVHIRDLLRLLSNWQPLRRDVIRPAVFVPEPMSVERVLGVMRKNRTHAVIVMDEQGGTAGMLTVKDLFEEVVGTIEDAVDVEGRSEAFHDEAGRLHVFGTLRAVELTEVLSDTLDDPLPETDAETVSGLVLLQLGRPARVGDTVRHGAVRLVVIAVEGRGVKECLVEFEG
jgi:CBS domain containing-hemolysin-like protein